MESIEKVRLTVEQADQDIEIVVYTDPLCCWSWAFETQLYQLQAALQPRVLFRFCMGGMLPSWSNFRDEANFVTRPLQMGPVWMHAGQLANRPINHAIWMKDPPASSYPACIAVKAAQLQSNTHGLAYLQMLRQACMTNGENIAKQTVLEAVAAKLAASDTQFNLAKFKADLTNENGLHAFRKDMDEVQKYQVTRFPTLVVRASGKAILIAGYRPFTEVTSAIRQIIPELPLI